MIELMIFKAGKYPQGDWSKERVQKLVEAYDPQKNVEAPVVIGHRWYSDTDEAQFAHGWVQSLRMDGSGKVYAVVDEFSSDVKKAVAEKKLRYISAEFWENDRRDASASPYLKAVALLGRDSPAVPGAKLPAIFSRDGFAENEIDKEKGITAFTRKLSAGDIAAFADCAGAGQNKIHEEENDMDEEKLKALEARFEKQSAELAEAKAQIAAFQKENGELRNAERKTEAASFFGKLRDEGKLPPALFEKAVELDTKMTEEERKEYRALFFALETKVDLSGQHAAPKGKAPPADAADAGLTAKIRAFQKEKGFASFSEAAEAYYAANPGAFEEGGGE
jgi:hypothetical protein